MPTAITSSRARTAHVCGVGAITHPHAHPHPPIHLPTMVAGYIIDYANSVRRRRAGPDASGKDPNHEIEHNFVLCHTLHPLTKLLFWVTNVPYWGLCYVIVERSLGNRLGESLVLECLKPLCANSHVHGVCVFVIAVASTSFHGFQLELDKQLSNQCGCLIGFTGFKMHKRKEDDAPDGMSLSTRSSSSSGRTYYPKPTPSRKRLIKKLLLCDVLCANVYVAFLMTCASLVQVLKVSVLPIACMFIAAQAKRKQAYTTYVLFHSLWHLGSAWAIYKAFGDERNEKVL